MLARKCYRFYKSYRTYASAIIRAVPKRHKLMIVAGEPSGDAHAAALVKALRERAELELFGATGPLMRDAGVETVVNSDELAIMGIVEVGRVFPKFLKAFRALKAAAIERSPDAVVLVDWPEFNLRLASALHRRGLKVIYYISPQLWAWRPRRVNKIKRDVDLLLSILPFEVDWYKEHNVDHIAFVGHPLSGEVKARYGREEFCRRNDLDPSWPIVSFLPGSRHKELHRILPPMLDAIAQLHDAHPEVQPVIVLAPSRTEKEARAIMSQSNSNIKLVQQQTLEALAASDAAAIASGTATLEAALLETPMVIVYKESSINWHTLGRLITVSHYGLVNLIAGQEIAKELMQDDLVGENLARELVKLLERETNRAVRASLRDVAHKLGEPGASQRAAERIIEFLTTD
ncbi:MAG TPA: lipid-A-disaccharide synthase [Pyrinomonadaceae bacterium]|nr:lipid-A-disaccharide synthase [Pyrinomonadaceae bacterium]